MCGIAGIFNYAYPDRAVDRDLLQRMTSALAHRGPNGEGLWVDGPIGFGHRRLAIVDLSPAGAQPMTTADGGSVITYNGEIYNHADLRNTLAANRRFRGHSDTETLLHLLADHGTDRLGELRGIFAFGYWNARKRSLILARDQLGVKQLYFHDDGQRVLFASEIKALLVATTVEREIDSQAVNEYLHFHTPLGDRTFFKGVRLVRPAECIRYTAGRPPRSSTYWTLDEFEPFESSPARLAEELGHELSTVIQSQLMSDVPVGAFLSGGVDSSAITAFARRAGMPPRCFGVHFSDHSVIDERPYQEATARALGVELSLTTLGGSDLTDELPRLLRAQDQPMVGPAMLPMSAVSRLAAQEVRVCLGGQAADELFGGYSRYALCEPLLVAQSAVRARTPAAPHKQSGNLLKQLREGRTIQRLLSTGVHVDWRRRYFDNFAQVPETTWLDVLSPEAVSRETCWLAFTERVERSAASSPAAKAMHWELQSYLPALFHQDDRMSMMWGLESRVPFADVRLARFAFRIPVRYKLRGGASKWILREAVRDLLPASVLTRRKVGFDTPIETWLQRGNAGFLRDILLSQRARQRGLLLTDRIRARLERPPGRHWIDVFWKLLCIELWARELIDGVDSPRRFQEPLIVDSPLPPHSVTDRLRHAAREVYETGISGTLFRIELESRHRLGLTELRDRCPHLQATDLALEVLPFNETRSEAQRALDILTETAREDLRLRALSAARGRIVAFGAWQADFGMPVDWYKNPENGRRWNPKEHWSRVLKDERRVGDVKLTWELGRFPHVYDMVRASLAFPELEAPLSNALAEQVRSFCQAAPYPRSIHWLSGQEIVIRTIAWLFSVSALAHQPAIQELLPLLAKRLELGAVHLERHLDYSLKSVYNNHLLFEAVGLVQAALCLPGVPRSSARFDRGMDILTRQAERQFYSDGSYIQESHNYERAALCSYLWCCALLKKSGRAIPGTWLSALERALSFLHAQMNPEDGRLPNYGANDGSNPLPLASADFADFRPILQAVSVLVRGKRAFAPGACDEPATWLFGSISDLEYSALPLGNRSRPGDGYHVLRPSTPSSFCVLRCGDVRERFSQIDMLSLDVWWRGHNVVTDPGSYLYNGPPDAHNHFLQTSSHSTLTIDRANQMVHHRRFRNLYLTRARRSRFEEGADFAIVGGEHSGYRRRHQGATHHRSVLQLGADVWVVLDTVGGNGEHDLRLHWLLGDFPHQTDSFVTTLHSPRGDFSISTHDELGRPLRVDVARGQHTPPRGWISRYYARKKAAPSVALRRRQELPVSFVTLMSGDGVPRIRVEGHTWHIAVRSRSFRLHVQPPEFFLIDDAKRA